MSYTSIFNMLLYSKWEDRLTEFLRWLVAHSPALAAEMVRRGGITEPIARVDARPRERIQGEGAPDAALSVTLVDGSTGVIAIEVKLGAPTTGLQQKEYRGWLDAQGPGKHGFLLVCPARRTDLAAAHTRLLTLEEAFGIVAEEGGAVTLRELVQDARAWFVDPEITAAEVRSALLAEEIPYWPIKDILRGLQARIEDAAGGALELGNIAADQGRSYYGFKISRAGFVIGWCGFYIDENDGGFYVNLDRGAVPAHKDQLLGVHPDGGFPPRPWYWQPAKWDGPWSASSLWQGGLEALVREMAASKEAR